MAFGPAADLLTPGQHGTTFGGNPVVCAAALAVLDVFEDESLVERASAVGDVIRTRMLAWQERWAEIGDVRGLGAMLAIFDVERQRLQARAGAAILRTRAA